MKLDEAKVALVTGASRGIGRALVTALAARGVRVIATARDRAKLDDLEKLANKHDRRVCVMEGDIALAETAKRLVHASISTFGGLDIVINNAGLINQPAPIERVSHDEWRSIVDVNILGVTSVCREAIGALRQRAGGIIVNLSSYWGHVGEAEFGPYCASKFAVEGLSQSLAKEVKKDQIIVVAVRPGMVVTDMLEIATRGNTEGHKSAELCSQQLLKLLEKLTLHDSGRPQELG